MQTSPIPTSQTGVSLTAADSTIIQEAKYFSPLIHDAAAKGKASDIESLVVTRGVDVDFQDKLVPLARVRVHADARHQERKDWGVFCF